MEIAPNLKRKVITKDTKHRNQAVVRKKTIDKVKGVQFHLTQKQLML